MTRSIGTLTLAFGLLALAGRICGQTSPVLDLHTVSIHVDSVETYNAVYRLLIDEYRWPKLYGSVLSPDMRDKRNYAGIWAGNLCLEICGPYPSEFREGDATARLHGLTFRPYESAAKSADELARRQVGVRGPYAWGTKENPMHFVLLNDAALIRPLFAVSIMEVTGRRTEEAVYDKARAALAASRGGPFGLRSVREIRVTYENEAALAKWREFLNVSSVDGAARWSGGRGPALHFVKGPRNGIDAVVLDSASLPDGKTYGVRFAAPE